MKRRCTEMIDDSPLICLYATLCVKKKLFPVRPPMLHRNDDE